MKEQLARQLWESGAVHINVSRPFNLPHAPPTPIYVDVRALLYSASTRRNLICALASEVRAWIRHPTQIDLCVGDETAGIPLAALLAQEFDARFAYVRRTVKGYGLNELLECGTARGQSTVFVTDLVHVGSTITRGLEHLVENDCKVIGVWAILNRCPIQDYQPYENLGIRLHSLLRLDEVLAAGREARMLGKAEDQSIAEYLAQNLKRGVYMKSQE